MQATGISTIDIAIIFGYFALVIGIGLWISRSTKTGEDLFLGGRSFGWGLIGLSLFASNISSTTIIKVANWRKGIGKFTRVKRLLDNTNTYCQR